MYYQWVKRTHLKEFKNASVAASYKKVAVKANNDDWIGTQDPAIILFSTESAFHESTKGPLNVEVLLSTIRNNVNGTIIILMTEMAHINVISLLYKDDTKKAFEKALSDAHSLIQNNKDSFNGCRIEFWNDFISNDPEYTSCSQRIAHRYETDETFRTLLQKDADKTYTAEMQKKFPNKPLYIERTIKDLLEQAIYVLIGAQKGYRFDFYPGKQNSSFLYISEHLVAPEQKIAHVHLNISYEKK